MAFTRGWDNTTPPGTRDADEIDDAMRELKVDVSERLISKLFVSMPNTTTEADIVVQPQILGNVTGKVLLFGPHILANRQDEHNTQHQDNYVELDITETMNGQLLLPVGVTITEFDAVVDRQLSGTVTVELYAVAYLTGVKTTIATRTRSANGIGLTSAGALSYAVVSDSWVGIRVVSTGATAARFYGCRVTYTTPDCRNTI